MRKRSEEAKEADVVSKINVARPFERSVFDEIHTVHTCMCVEPDGTLFLMCK